MDAALKLGQNWKVWDSTYSVLSLIVFFSYSPLFNLRYTHPKSSGRKFAIKVSFKNTKTVGEGKKLKKSMYVEKLLI